VSTASKVQASAPIRQTGALGYLLWLRRDLPAVYKTVAGQFPELAQFEGALQRQSAGLGDDAPDLTAIDTSGFDFSSPSDFSAVTMADFTIPEITPPVITVPTELPTVNFPPEVSGASSSAASLISGATLSSIAQAVAATVPGLVNVGSAVVNYQATQKAIATSNLQLAAALAGRSPLQTGYVSGPAGAYLAPISSLGGELSSSLLGLPLWVYLVGAIGLVAVLVAE
jgi:hypothetical protein